MLSPFFELAPMPYLVIGRGGNIQHANQRAAALLGAWHGRPLADWTTAESRATLAACMAQAMGQDAHARGRIQLHTTGQWFQLEASPTADGQACWLALMETTPPLPTEPAFWQSALDQLPFNVAILDAEGVVRVVNNVWRNFGRQNGLAHGADGVGMNYLQVCDTAAAQGVTEAADVARAIRHLLEGQLSHATIEYPCATPEQYLWFDARLAAFEHGGQTYVLVVHEDITATKAAEAEMIYHTTVLANLSDAVISTDTELHIRSWNPGAEKLYGWAEKEVLGRRIDEVCGTEFLAGSVAENQARIAAEGAWHGEVRQKRRDGTPFYAQAHVSLIKDDRGVVVGGVTINTDITASKQTEQALYEARIFLSSLLELAPISIYTLTPDSKFHSVNQQWEHDTQKSRDNVIGRALEEIFPRPLARHYRRDNEWVLANGILEAEEEAETPHGRRWYHTVKFPLRDTAGQVTLIGGLSLDITERKQAENNLLAYFNSTHDAIFLLDPNYHILAFNQQASQSSLRAYGRTVLVGDSLLDYSEPATTADFKRNFARALAGELVQIEREITHPNTRVWWSVTYRPMRDQNDNIIGVTLASADITAQKQTETELKAKTEELNQFFATSLDLLCIADFEGYFRRLNPQWQNTLGYPLETLLATPAIELIHPDDLGKTQDMLAKMSIGEPVINFENRYRHQNGDYRWIEWRATPATNLIYAAARDVTDRKLREREMEVVAAVGAALRHAPTRAAMTPIILDQLLALLDVDGARLDMIIPNQAQIEVELGRGVWQSLTGMRWPILAGGLDGDIINSGKSYLTDNILDDPRLKQARLFMGFPSAAGVPLVAQREIMGVLWVGSKRPLTPYDLHLLTAVGDMVASAIHRTTLHEKTQAQAEQIAQITRSVPDGVLLLGPQAQILLQNPVAETYLRFLLGPDVPPVLTHLGGRPLAEFLAAPPAGQWHVVQQNGRTFELLARPLATAPIRDGWVLVLRDITERVLVQKQLQQQERLAAVGQLAAGIAHDFNNLMAVIMLHAQLAARSPNLSPRDHERLAVINNQTEQAARMIQQILDFSRRSVLERQAVDLKPLLREQFELLQRTLPENIELAWECAGNDYWVELDPTRIQQAIMNLAINARDAMPHGGRLVLKLGRLTITTPTAQLGRGEWIQITVSDTGSGIPDEALPHIFEPFFSTKGPGKGTGLGLPQVHGIVAQHNGYLDVQTAVGQGTTFTLYLPALNTKTVTPTKELPAYPVGQGELILVVEDNEVLRVALVDYLQMWDYRTLEAGNGREALATLAASPEPVSLILTDAVMPYMGGLELVRTLSAQKANIPVILLTGHPLHEDEIGPLEHQGLYAWLPKPPDLSLLSQSIAAALNASRPA